MIVMWDLLLLLVWVFKMVMLEKVVYWAKKKGQEEEKMKNDVHCYQRKEVAKGLVRWYKCIKARYVAGILYDKSSW